MATPNYGYEKRQRELAKKNKKADKLREKSERKTNPEQTPEGEPEQPQNSLPTPPAAQ